PDGQHLIGFDDPRHFPKVPANVRQDLSDAFRLLVLIPGQLISDWQHRPIIGFSADLDWSAGTFRYQADQPVRALRFDPVGFNQGWAAIPWIAESGFHVADGAVLRE